MRSFRSRLRTFAWLALAAIAGIAIVPTVSRTLVLDASDVPVVVGQRMVRMDAAIGDDAVVSHAAHHHEHDGSASASSTGHSSHSHSLDHCGLCVLATCAFVAATVQVWLNESLSRERTAARQCYVLLPLRRQWSPAISCGPPALV